MSVTGYVGVPGAGKGYALVADVILPALRAGRSVVANVEGLKLDAIAAYIGKPVDEVRLKTFVGTETNAPRFFPDDGAGPFFVQPGDLFVMDEVRVFWPPSKPFPEPVVAFMRMHRHFIDANGVATDIVLCSQVITDFHREVRGLIERTFKFKKLTTLGLPSRYVWNMWEGARLLKDDVVSNGGGKFDTEIFKLYSSYKAPVGVVGIEQQTDKRSNVMMRKKYWVIAALLLVGCVASLYYLMQVFGGHKSFAGQAGQAVASSAGPAVLGSAAHGVAPGAAIPVAAAPLQSPLRLAGTYRTHGALRVIFVDAGGNLVTDNTSDCIVLGDEVSSCKHDGKIVTETTGLSPPTGLAGVL